ncbi:hypothetical protein AHiyo6_22180, partial [Arthrobacter sp. Hiyo6]
MAQDFLHCPEVGSAVEKMGGSRMTEGVGPGGGGITQCLQKVPNHTADLSLIHPLAP